METARDTVRTVRLRAAAREVVREVEQAKALGDASLLEGYGANRSDVANFLKHGAAVPRGNVIDAIFKKRVETAYQTILETTPRGRAGPDVYNPLTLRSWDITTSSAEVRRKLYRYVLNVQPNRQGYRTMTGFLTNEPALRTTVGPVSAGVGLMAQSEEE